MTTAPTLTEAAMPDEIDRYRKSATESDMLKAFADVALIRGGVIWHVRDSRELDVEGLPDVLILAPPVVGLFELKTQYDRVSPRQRQVLGLLADCERLASGLVRPVPKDGELSLDDALRMLT